MDPSSAFTILVVIANYGTGNDKYLLQLIEEYRSMPYSIDIVVTSNLPKQLGSDIDVVVGLPTANPRSLPFAHKQIFADHVDDYDLFIYSEDDTLVTKRNIEAFVAAAAVLPDGEVPGFLRIEKDAQGNTHFPDVHHRFHWDPQSVNRRGKYTFAFFTNEHAACYLLTRQQLQRAIRSGGFLVDPHQGKYDMLETAATDVYTQCGMKKMMCISELDRFLVHHLPNKYVGKMGVHDQEVLSQVDALLQITADMKPPSSLFETQPKSLTVPFSAYYSKSYYEPPRTEIEPLLPASIRNVLSIGCGWGETEQWLSKKGVKVVAVPIDPIISACAKARGIQLVPGDLDGVRRRLGSQRFDCLLLPNVLHLIDNPTELLSSFSDLLSDDAVVVVIVPNLLRIGSIWKHVRRGDLSIHIGNYENTGVHFTSGRVLRRWCRRAGLTVERIVNLLPEQSNKSRYKRMGWLGRLLASELIAVARPAKSTSRAVLRANNIRVIQGAQQSSLAI